MEKVLMPNEVMLGEISRLIEEGHEVLMIPKGISMLPFIRGEKDHVRLCKPGKLQVGNIVLAYIDGRYVLHRIYALKGDRITLMGDGNLQGCEQGTLADVKGVVTEIITPEGRSHKPGKAWLWRHTIGLRKYLLKIYRKTNKLLNHNN
jgi:hypothetical protein